MYPAYYALRRLNPYRGITQVVDLGDSMAHSYDGSRWHIRGDDGYGMVRPTGVWIEGQGLAAGQPAQQREMLDALQYKPKPPYRLIDRLELWLLDKETGLPLALLNSARPSARPHNNVDPEWQPFTPRYQGFVSPALLHRQTDSDPQPARHRDMLARIVNQAARPYPAAQWFRRQEDGTGEGLGGLRVPPEWKGRRLAGEAFPELLVRETWNSRLEKSVIADYHSWLAPLLLLLPDLSEATRGRLEREAFARPLWVSRIHQLLPRILDHERYQATLVAARLEAASGNGELDLLD